MWQSVQKLYLLWIKHTQLPKVVDCVKLHARRSATTPNDMDCTNGRKDLEQTLNHFMPIVIHSFLDCYPMNLSITSHKWSVGFMLGEFAGHTWKCPEINKYRVTWVWWNCAFSDGSFIKVYVQLQIYTSGQAKWSLSSDVFMRTNRSSPCYVTQSTLE